MNEQLYSLFASLKTRKAVEIFDANTFNANLWGHKFNGLPENIDLCSIGDIIGKRWLLLDKAERNDLIDFPNCSKHFEFQANAWEKVEQTELGNAIFELVSMAENNKDYYFDAYFKGLPKPESFFYEISKAGKQLFLYNGENLQKKLEALKAQFSKNNIIYTDTDNLPITPQFLPKSPSIILEKFTL